MTFKDQLNRTISLEGSPKRIVSLVPSQTELLFDLGLEEETVGITKFCIHPASLKTTKKIIGGTKNPAIDQILDLQPDLIIANKEENLKEHVDSLSEKLPVWVSDVNTIEDSLEMIGLIGELTNKNTESKTLTQNIENELNTINSKGEHSAAYLIWRNPYMTVGGDTFISSVLAKCGIHNIFAEQNRYPQTILEEIKQKSPDYLFLSSEPYPFKQNHLEELKHFLPNIKVRMVDGEMFSWYGSRLLKLAQYWNNLQL